MTAVRGVRVLCIQPAFPENSTSSPASWCDPTSSPSPIKLNMLVLLFNILLTPASKTAATMTPEIIIFYHSLFVLRYFLFLLQPGSSHSCGELFCINQPVEYWISSATGNVVLCAVCVWLIITTSKSIKSRQKEPPSGRFCYWSGKAHFYTPVPSPVL